MRVLCSEYKVVVQREERFECKGDTNQVIQKARPKSATQAITTSLILCDNQ